jgi:hypothetical protein
MQVKNIAKTLETIPNKIMKQLTNLRPTKTASKPKKNHRKVFLAAIYISTLILLGAITGILDPSKNIVKANTINGIGAGIYWNQACTDTPTSFNWGNIHAGSNKTLTIYVRNENNLPVSLSLSTSNWTPSNLADYMSLAWNYSGQILKISEVVPLQITLTINPTINGITDFSFTTTITAIQH